jgi:hypothetical protein
MQIFGFYISSVASVFNKSKIQKCVRLDIIWNITLFLINLRWMLIILAFRNFFFNILKCLTSYLPSHFD